MTSPVKPDIVYPAGELTPHGWWHLTNGTRPTMRLRAYDGSVDFYLLGPYAPPFHDPTMPEAVALKSLKGLIPPWQHITQKGATQDGITHVDALLDPIEVEMVVECMARDPKNLKRVVRDLVASLDAKQQSELAFWTEDLGWWWAPVRWNKGAPGDPLGNQERTRQQLSLRLSADDACWRSYDDVSTFGFTYEAMTDTFQYTTGYSTTAMGANWPARYTPTGASGLGYIMANGSQAVWMDNTGFNTATRSVVVGPRASFNTTTDNQVISIVLGGLAEWSLPEPAYNDIWGRMGRSGSAWNGNGIRARVGFGLVRLSRFNNFNETVLQERPLLVQPLPGEKFTLICGAAGNSRFYTIRRNDFDILTHQERGTASQMNSSHRGVGFGMQASAALLTQATPASVRKISAGDNATVSQGGFLSHTNIGDQPMYVDAVVFGPGVFRIWDGPGASEYVEFGPLLPNQVAMLRTDPRSHTPLVQDLTSVPPTPQELNFFQAALKRLTGAAANSNVFLQQIESAFGITPPQGPMYSLLNGRFSSRAAIPPKSPGRPAEPHFLKVEIDDGNAASRIISTGTPRRRYPL